MKEMIVTLGCLVIAPLAFAQPNSTDKKQGATTTEPIEVTGTIIRTMIAEARLPVISLAKRSLFGRTVRMIRAVMFSMGVVTL